VFVLTAARADDVWITAEFDGTGPGAGQTVTHQDDVPFKGWVHLDVTNTGTEPWGDFHFEFVDVGWDVSNISFIVDPPYEPNSTQSPLSWAVDNDVVPARLDLFFYTDPVLPSASASFTIYTDNTVDQVPFFGLLFYPTPIPEPASAALLSLGLVTCLRARRR